MKVKGIAKKLVTMLMALIMLVTSITVYQPQTVEAAAKNRITLKVNIRHSMWGNLIL